jgi:glycosyltransferase involved in cell wall biosynthesis
MNTSNSPAVSVVIPALNEEFYIGNLLESLTHQTLTNFEVIFVDGKSTDKTVQVVEGFKNKLNLQVVVPEQRGVANQRNQGAAKAKGKWLMFLDSDTTLPPEFLEVLVADAESRKLATLCPVFVPRTKSWLEKFGTHITVFYMRLFERSKHPMAGGFAIFTSADWFRKTKGFDTKLIQGEDHNYVEQIVALGGKFGYTRKTRVFVSTRRFEGKNRFLFFLKYVGSEIYRFTHGWRIEKDIMNYQFGKFGKPKE